MSKSSIIRTIFMAILLLSCTATSTYASMFELEIVPLSKIKEDPTVYDSTMAYRKISVIGNFSELTKQSAVLTDGPDSLKIDTAKIELFDGFNVSEQALVTGEFIHEPIAEDKLIPTYILRYPIVDMGLVNISEIVVDPAYHNGKYMTVTGNMSAIEQTMGRYTITIRDEEDNAMRIYFYGSTALETGDPIEVTGLYNGNVLHSESMGLNRPPLSISTLVPGFTSIMGAIAILSIALLLKSGKRND
ncbi:hypothetical protein [Methanolobus sp. WCC4]|uniref:hypothetical protein n=1 Tax=Methanolobus sp. WCC4 TaxID=3125784 RepID=UPI0030FD0499